ncbi:MAG: hypothetical protein CVV37_02360 [Nitrospira bacterium HGW-Nitrospira-1]|nr:MAG: hypothetical protein CVV37_02360 [Nitrospira bacterium HGW-Nitrospira-1]
MSKNIIQISGTLTVILSIFLLTGCAGTMQAIQHREMSLSAKMSNTVFLDPEVLAKNKNVFIRVTNTSDFQEINFGEILKNKLISKGLTVTDLPSKAGYIIQANLLYMGQEKQDLTEDGMLAGGFGGALLGSSVGGDWRGQSAAALGAGIVGSVVGGMAGSLVHVDTYLGSVDIQIKEASETAVTGKMFTNASQGSATTLQTKKEIKSNFQEYRTRIVVKATQTNINRNEACNAITDRLAAQIAGMF